MPLFEVGMGGQPFSVNFSPKSAGLYTYFCPPHKSFAKGFIEVVASPSSRCAKKKKVACKKGCAWIGGKRQARACTKRHQGM